MDYKKKYKLKYLNLKELIGGVYMVKNNLHKLKNIQRKNYA